MADGPPSESRCDRCGADVRRSRPMIRDGRPVALGVDCGCVAYWEQMREFREYRDSGVTPR